MSTQAFGWSKTKDEDYAAVVREFASDVRNGLAKPQKELHSKYLYDELGSSLFEAITHLPEYGFTRADERLLRRHAGDIASLLPLSRRGYRTGQRSGAEDAASAAGHRREPRCAIIPSTYRPTPWRVASAICRTSPRCIRWFSPISTGWRAPRPNGSPAKRSW